mmetsp:Transcript_39979/g.104863  ORF Transcript_39979/g.104863 Transcript_39979/m.104863 type:complete len:419 (+) Transcript_39979:290-1546(+)
MVELGLRNHLPARQRLDHLEPRLASCVKEPRVELLAPLLVPHHDARVGIAAHVLEGLQERVDKRLVPDDITCNDQIRGSWKRLDSLRQGQPIQNLEFARPAKSRNGVSVLGDIPLRALSNNLAIRGNHLGPGQRSSDRGDPAPAPQINDHRVWLIRDPLLELVFQRLGQHNTCIPDAKTSLIFCGGVVHLHLQWLIADLEITLEIELRLQESRPLQDPRRRRPSCRLSSGGWHLLPHRAGGKSAEGCGGRPDNNLCRSLRCHQSRLLPRHHHSGCASATGLALGHRHLPSARLHHLRGLRPQPLAQLHSWPRKSRLSCLRRLAQLFRLAEQDPPHGLRRARTRRRGVATAEDRHLADRCQARRGKTAHNVADRESAAWRPIILPHWAEALRDALWDAVGDPRAAGDLGHGWGAGQQKT